MIKYILILAACFISLHHAIGQSYWFGAKGGIAMNNQVSGVQGGGSGGGGSMFSFNGDLFLETYDEFKKGALYAALGHHTRGSALRFQSLQGFNNLISFKFNNITLELGAKKAWDIGSEFSPYFILGVRGEYTLSTRLPELSGVNTIMHPDYVQKWNYGVTAGGGFDMYLSEMSQVFVEFAIMPDLSFQYDQPPLFGIANPWFPNERVDLPLKRLRNLAIEAKVGIRFLRKVEYY